MGPLCADIFDPRSWSDANNRVTLEVMRVVLATGLFAIGADLPKGYMYKHAKGLVVMVVPTMTVGWFIVAGQS
jgi:NhaP-type Na+/H+ or K+/H+ antiporter